MTKYRIRKRARGWAIREWIPMKGPFFKSFWLTIGVYRWRWLARSLVWMMRETERMNKARSKRCS